MSIQHKIISMATNSLTGETMFRVELFEDLGIAKITRGTLEVTLPEKYEGIDQAAEKAVSDFLAQHANALGMSA